MTIWNGCERKGNCWRRGKVTFTGISSCLVNNTRRHGNICSQMELIDDCCCCCCCFHSEISDRESSSLPFAVWRSPERRGRWWSLGGQREFQDYKDYDDDDSNDTEQNIIHGFSYEDRKLQSRFRNPLSLSFRVALTQSWDRLAITRNQKVINKL